MKKVILITGGQRSGKSLTAERMALSLSPTPVYLATAHAWDEEFKQRIARHQERRGPCWTNIEEEKTLSKHLLYNKVVVVDCIDAASTLPDIDKTLEELKAEFDKLTAQEATFIFVTNEIGSGGVSNNALQRRFTDLQGWMNQYVAAKADEVYLMVSGIAVKIK